MSRRRSRPNLTPGEDSFLDVVANLVGILIILVMVLGVRAREAYLEVVPLESSPDGPTEQEVAHVRSKADELEKDVHTVAARIKRHELELDYRQRERDKILIMLTAAERQIEEEKQALSTKDQEKLQRRTQLEQLRRDLAQTEQARSAAESATDATSVIDHLPTPMARTVFGNELHFRLMDGKLTYLPWEELVQKLKDEASQKLWKLKDASLVHEEAGPVAGFRIRYALRRVEHSMPSKMGPVTQRRIELDHFQLVPISEDMGEPIDAVWKNNSQFRGVLAANPPKQTTITVWVYPEGFEQFRQLKSELYKLGYLTAARPMPKGRLIGGSPQGSRSASQ
jgi:hypothetical protein